MRVALYARVSTRDRQEVENQLLQLRAEAARGGHDVTAEYIDTESGASADRPRFQAMMHDACRRRFDLLLFWSLDRFSRQGVAQTIAHLKRLEDYGVKFRSLRQPEIDTTATWGWVVISLFAALAEIERGLIVERTRAGLERARRQGKQIGRPRRVVDAERIRELAAAGVSVRGIARQLGISPATAARRRKVAECLTA